MRPPPPCPTIRILADAATVTKFREGPGNDLTDIVFEGEITDYNGQCTYDVDSDTGAGTLELELAIRIGAVEGPANSEGRATFDYFVTVIDVTAIDSQQTVLNKRRFEILNKRRFHTGIEFPGNRTRLVYEDQPVVVIIFLTAGAIGSDFLIYVGFQLSREELQFNRRRRKALML